LGISCEDQECVRYALLKLKIASTIAKETLSMSELGFILLAQENKANEDI
jgi:hypothetical protein